MNQSHDIYHESHHDHHPSHTFPTPQDLFTNLMITLKLIIIMMNGRDNIWANTGCNIFLKGYNDNLSVDKIQIKSDKAYRTYQNTCSRPRFPLFSHFLVCGKKNPTL